MVNPIKDHIKEKENSMDIAEKILKNNNAKDKNESESDALAKQISDMIKSSRQ